VQNWVPYLHGYNTSLEVYGVTATWTTSPNALLVLANNKDDIDSEIKRRQERFDPMFKELDTY
ncbi:MAG: hypothetical protein LBS55_03595, partial [Prevotellaceae bacterium]|jgi:hypothetical protein|nr:hypothetical protein [Prevotellaceae bacterium]